MIYPLPHLSDIETFAQMIWDNASAVGCAIVKIPKSIHITCTFDKALTEDSSVYIAGPVGSKCRMGRNRRYCGLCNVNEFNANASEAQKMIEWIQNGKNIAEELPVCSAAHDKSVDWLTKIILPLSLFIAKKFIQHFN